MPPAGASPPTIALGLGTDTQWSLSYMHQHTDAIPDYGLVVAQRPGQLIAEPVSEYGVPRNTFTGFNTDEDRNDADLVTMRIAHQATRWLTVSNDTRVASYSRYFQYTTTDTCDFTAATNFCSSVLFGQATPTSAVGTADPKTTLAQIGGSGPYVQNSWGVQDVATAKADFKLGAFRNVTIAGFDLSYQNADRTIYAYRLPTLAQYTYQLGDHTVNPAATSAVPLFFNNTNHSPPPGYTMVYPTAATIAGTNDTSTSVVTSGGRATDLAFFARTAFISPRKSRDRRRARGPL